MDTFEKLKNEIAEETKTLLRPEINKTVQIYMDQKGVSKWHQMLSLRQACSYFGLSREKVKEIIAIELVPYLTQKKFNRFGEGTEIKIMYKDFLAGLERHLLKSFAKTTGRPLPGGSWDALRSKKRRSESKK